MTEDRRSTYYAILLGTWLMVAIYAILHDQYIVRIAPEHFTEYHEPIGTIRSPYLLSAIHAFGASVSPGFLLGLALALLGRKGSRPKFPVKKLLGGVPIIICLSELGSLAAGGWVYLFKRPLYPVFLYPDKSIPMLITQTIQLTCYILAGFLSFCFLVYIWRKRNQQSNCPHQFPRKIPDE